MPQPTASTHRWPIMREWWSHLHLDKARSPASLAICNGCSILGRIFPLIAAQKVGPINTLITFAFTSAVMLFVWTRATDIPGILTYDAFYGISSGRSGLVLVCSIKISTETDTR
jgi:hypothetical protein